MNKNGSREALIEVGLELMRSTGYSATGINRIMQIAKARSFYNHFKSKNELVLEVIKRYTAGEHERLKTVFDDSDLSPLGRLRHYFKVMIATHGRSSGPIEGCLLGNLTLELPTDNEDIRCLLRQELDLWQDALASMIRQAVKRHELPRTTKANEVAALLVNSWQGAQVRAKTQQSDDALHLFFDSAFNVLLKPVTQTHA